jgi:cytochrome oxidase assembly protein ShyY1
MVRHVAMSMRFRPGWSLSMLVLALVPLGVALGAWQLHRGEQKRVLEEGYLASLGGLPISEAELRSLGTAVALRRVRLIGTYDAARQFYVDNRTHRGASGYWVVTPFTTSQQTAYLVNRGWIGANGRESLPAAPVPTGVQRIEVVAWPPTGLGLLARADEWAEDWPKRVQQLDVERMAQHVPLALVMELRLEAGSPGVLEPVAATVDLSPARHLGYAVQWFALALALSLTWIVVGVRRGRGSLDARVTAE